MLCRKSLEEWVRWMYERDADLVLPYDTTLSSLLHEQQFKNLVAPIQFNQINLIRRLGNNAVHTSAKIKPQEAKAELTKAYGEQPLGKFIRSIVGLEVQAAKLAFAEILNNQTLNAPQIRFMDTIINFLNIKGIIEPSMLFESPFTDINSNGVAGVFEAQIASKIISLIEIINHNAEAA
jgi:type I restriction enzyme R subunit